MLSRNDILETIRMIDQQHLDIRTITMGISLLSCADRSAERACEKIYDKISRYAELWGDRIFEKCGIRRDEEGDGGKTLEIRGKRRLSARDGGANYQQS